MSNIFEPATEEWGGASPLNDDDEETVTLEDLDQPIDDSPIDDESDDDDTPIVTDVFYLNLSYFHSPIEVSRRREL